MSCMRAGRPHRIIYPTARNNAYCSSGPRGGTRRPKASSLSARKHRAKLSPASPVTTKPSPSQHPTTKWPPSACWTSVPPPASSPTQPRREGSLPSSMPHSATKAPSSIVDSVSPSTAASPSSTATTRHRPMLLTRNTVTYDATLRRSPRSAATGTDRYLLWVTASPHAPHPRCHVVVRKLARKPRRLRIRPQGCQIWPRHSLFELEANLPRLEMLPAIFSATAPAHIPAPRRIRPRRAWIWAAGVSASLVHRGSPAIMAPLGSREGEERTLPLPSLRATRTAARREGEGGGTAAPCSGSDVGGGITPTTILFVKSI